MNMANLYVQNYGFEKALKCIEIALESSQKAKNQSLECESYLYRSLILVCMKDMKPALESLKLAYKLQINDNDLELRIKSIFKNTKKINNLFDRVVNSYGNQENLLKIYEKIADNSVKIEAYYLASEYYQKTLEIALSLSKPKNIISSMYYSIATTYIDLKNFAEASKYFARELRCHNEDFKQATLCHYNIAFCKERMRKSIDETESAYKSALNQAEKSRDYRIEIKILKDFIDFLLTNGKCETSDQYRDKFQSLKTDYSISDDEINDWVLENLCSNDNENELDNDENSSSVSEIELEEIKVDSQSNSHRAYERKSFIINDKGESRIHLAVIQNDLEKLKKLILNGHPINIRDNIGWTPLHEAANYGLLEIGVLLIENGANINDEGKGDCGGVTPLIDAATNGHLKFIEMLVEKGVDISKKDYYNKDAHYYLNQWFQSNPEHETIDLDLYYKCLEFLTNTKNKEMFKNIQKAESAKEQKQDVPHKSKKIDILNNGYNKSLEPEEDHLLREKMLNQSDTYSWGENSQNSITDELDDDFVANRSHNSKNIEKSVKNDIVKSSEIRIIDSSSDEESCLTKAALQDIEFGSEINFTQENILENIEKDKDFTKVNFSSIHIDNPKVMKIINILKALKKMNTLSFKDINFDSNVGELFFEFLYMVLMEKSELKKLKNLSFDNVDLTSFQLAKFLNCHSLCTIKIIDCVIPNLFFAAGNCEQSCLKSCVKEISIINPTNKYDSSILEDLLEIVSKIFAKLEILTLSGMFQSGLNLIPHLLIGESSNSLVSLSKLTIEEDTPTVIKIHTLQNLLKSLTSLRYFNFKSFLIDDLNGMLTMISCLGQINKKIYSFSINISTHNGFQDEWIHKLIRLAKGSDWILKNLELSFHPVIDEYECNRLHEKLVSAADVFNFDVTKIKLELKLK
ncbi:MAG: hypothetical protein MHPSP_000042 [Paramarteilia canceri]